MKICFATSEKTKGLIASDRILFESMKESGFQMETQVWNDMDVLWERFDYIIIRSCWDYHLNMEEFMRWINRIESLKLRVLNPPQLVKPNLKKSYLKELSSAGLRIVPTLWIDYHNVADLENDINANDWKEIVVKPNVGATAHAIARLSTSELGKYLNESKEKLKNGFLVQKFMPEIQTNGEWSIIFFGRSYSHSVLKKTNQDDFRVQYEYGGTHQFEEPNPAIIQQAFQIVSHYPDELLYARIDGIQVGNEFYLMEAELTEPELFVTNERIAERFINRLKELNLD